MSANKTRNVLFFVVLSVSWCACGLTQAQVAIETVTVANPGNAGELSGEGAGGFGYDRICGAVDYVYRIGKFEVTADQYTTFLNAVAAEDTHGLYNTDMADSSGSFGCNVQRAGSPGSYTYSVDPDWAQRPVNWVSWGDAARFCNWLHNGQPTGAQDLTTTEDGSYYLNGATTDSELMAVVRNPDARWVIPSEDEWYKAGYHHNDVMTGNYWDYPTGSDSIPSNDLTDPDPGNNANFHAGDGDYTIGGPYWRTVVGEFENTKSPYGTFDHGGNIGEWNESEADAGNRITRGCSYGDGVHTMHAAYRSFGPPTFEHLLLGFRVARVQPTVPAVSEWGMAVMTLLVLAAGTVILLRRRVAA
jgi:formylglycine-generating enzyme required for sulfatase activity